MTQYLTPKQVAERLQLAHQTILIYCNQGVFPGAFQAKKGGAWRIPEGDVVRRQQPPEPVQVASGVWLQPRNARSIAQQGRRRKGRS